MVTAVITKKIISKDGILCFVLFMLGKQVNNYFTQINPDEKRINTDVGT